MNGFRLRERFVSSHWFWFFAILTVMSALDYWDHIARPGSSFAQAPWAWLGFTAASHVTLLGLAYGAARLLAKLPIPGFAADTIGVGLAIAAHLLVTGPMWDSLFWGGNLIFDNVTAPTVVASLVYIAYRLAFLLAQRLATPPKSRA
ncbi:hypothetical protein CD351_03010 [Erythrobacter sp. KY5]|uniref:hypothetical protein n=1 Tax=Erythrobacter sp. KY5 TaxID=2011159 RepID=UPI000DBF0074|nr:hypothetical protein [Erythrobacter sp. KY5]AWW73394.1 hypothetical protein CD351_03010 [Erythrobacter sp. KY5]